MVPDGVPEWTEHWSLSYNPLYVEVVFVSTVVPNRAAARYEAAAKVIKRLEGPEIKEGDDIETSLLPDLELEPTIFRAGKTL